MDAKTGRQIDGLRIGELMKEYGFNADAPTSTARALILNLVRSAYGAEAARECMRQMNLTQADAVIDEPSQLPLFEPLDGQGTFLQKKSRRA